MTTQVSIFDGNEDFVIDKPIRLIECFAGYGSQHLALKYLGANVESYRICEWAVKSIQAYKDLHFPNDNTDYSADLTTDEVIDYLANKGISANYNNPMSREQVKRMGEAKCRQVYNNIKATHNLVNIMQAKASDLNIVERDKYCYIMTYSFPCQDLSKAGLGKGMAKDSGTRSGLLWEVERLLDECNGNLPQVLLMENVPDVIGTKNIKHFAKWLEKLESIGYKCYWKVLNGKDYGIPQNRERCFMVSVLGDYFYSFPQGIKLEKRLKHLLETQVDEKFYLSQQIINYFINHTQESIEKGNGFRFTPTDGDCVGRAITTRAGGRMDDNFIEEPPQCLQMGMLEGGKRSKMHDQSRRYYDADGLAPTIPTSSGGHHEPKIVEPLTCAMRGRNPDNPSDRTAGAPIQQRIEIGGTSANCLTTVQKDSMVAEPLVWDGFNQQIRADSTVVGTLTKNCGQDLKRNGRGIIEPTVINPLKDKTRYGWHFEQQVYDADGITRVVKAGDGSGNIPKVVELDSNNPYELSDAMKRYIVSYDGKYKVSDGNLRVNRDIACAKTTREGCTRADASDYISPDFDENASVAGKNLVNYRIRKLTPKECWRLMGVKDEDFERVAANQSNSSLYHLAGDSIITTVLMAIFSSMVGVDWKECLW